MRRQVFVDLESFSTGGWFACTKLAKVNRSKVALTGPKSQAYNEQEKYAGKSAMRKKTLGQHIVAELKTDSYAGFADGYIARHERRRRNHDQTYGARRGRGGDHAR